MIEIGIIRSWFGSFLASAKLAGPRRGRPCSPFLFDILMGFPLIYYATKTDHEVREERVCMVQLGPITFCRLEKVWNYCTRSLSLSQSLSCVCVCAGLSYPAWKIRVQNYLYMWVTYITRAGQWLLTQSLFSFWSPADSFYHSGPNCSWTLFFWVSDHRLVALFGQVYGRIV